MEKKKFAYLYGNKGKRKIRSPWYDNKKKRDFFASIDKEMGFRVRKIQKKVV